MAQNRNRSQTSRPRQSGTGSTSKPQPQQETPQTPPQGTTEASPSGSVDLLNDEALKTAYAGDENFKGEPAWEELEEEHRATYARLLQELSDAEGSADPVGNDEGNTGDGDQDDPEAPPALLGPTTATGQSSPEAITAAKQSPAFNKIAKPEGRIIGQNDPLTFEGDKVGNMIVVKENVYREVVPFRSKRPTYILLLTAGTQFGEGSVEAKAATVSEPQQSE